MSDISIFKKLEMFRFFRKVIRKNRSELLQRFNIRVDYAQRMYTVLNIPEDLFGEPYNIRKSDIDKISEKYIKEYTMGLSNYLNANGLGELYNFYELKKVDKYSYLIVVGYSMFRSNEFYNKIYFVYSPILFISSIILMIYFNWR